MTAWSTKRTASGPGRAPPGRLGMPSEAAIMAGRGAQGALLPNLVLEPSSTCSTERSTGPAPTAALTRFEDFKSSPPSAAAAGKDNTSHCIPGTVE